MSVSFESCDFEAPSNQWELTYDFSIRMLMRDNFLPFSPPLIGEEEIAEVVATLRSDWITTGPKVKQFEQQFMEFVEAPDSFAVSSCTAALHLSLLALGIGPGDAVLTTPMTFCS